MGSNAMLELSCDGSKCLEGVSALFVRVRIVVSLRVGSWWYRLCVVMLFPSRSRVARLAPVRGSVPDAGAPLPIGAHSRGSRAPVAFELHVYFHFLSILTHPPITISLDAQCGWRGRTWEVSMGYMLASSPRDGTTMTRAIFRHSDC